MLKSSGARKKNELETKNSWNLLKDTKSELRDVQENLTKYSSNPLLFKSPESNYKFLEISSINSTIQAGDSSLLFNNKSKQESGPSSSSYYKNTKTISSNNDYSNGLHELKSKYLNDFSQTSIENNTHSNPHSKPRSQKLTHVDIYVPSYKTRDRENTHNNKLIGNYIDSNYFNSNTLYKNGLNALDRMDNYNYLYASLSTNKSSIISKRHLASSAPSAAVPSSSSLNNLNSENSSKTSKRKIAIVNGQPEDLLKSSSSVLCINTNTNTNNNNGIITASSWRAGEALAQKQLKVNTNISRTSNNKTADLNGTKHQHQLKTKRTECHLVDTVPVKLIDDKQKKTDQHKSDYSLSKQHGLSSTKPYDLEGVHKYMNEKKTKRLYETRSERERQKKEEEERKRKLQELYKKQRSQPHQQQQQQHMPHYTSTFKNKSFASTPAQAEASEANAKILYERDMSKVLQEKIAYLLNDNDKLVEMQRNASIKNKRVNFETDFYQNQDYEYDYSIQGEQVNYKQDYQQDEYYDDNDDDDDDNENNQLESSNNYHSNNNNNNNSVTTAFEYKHDRLKKICSMALDLQTKLQQTKLKLFGANQNDDKTDIQQDEYELYNPAAINILNNKRIYNKNTSIHYEYELNKVDKELPGILNVNNFQPQQNQQQLSTTVAAKRIQKAFRSYLNKKDAKKNLTIQAKTFRFGSDLNDFKLKQNKPLKPQQQQLQQPLLTKPVADEYNFINVFRKKGALSKKSTTATATATTAAVTSATSITSRLSNKQQETLNKSLVSNNSSITSQSSSASTSTSTSTSTSLSKYMIEPEHVLIDKSNNKSFHSVSSSSSSSSSISTQTKTSSNKQNEENNETITSNSSCSTSNTLTANDSVSRSSKSKSKNKNPIADQEKPIVTKRTNIVKEISTEFKKELRYSPASLECLLNAGLNYLDTLNTSAIHLEELDKVRCIGMAQQDTVALAHLIKDQQQHQQQHQQHQQQQASNLIDKQFKPIISNKNEPVLISSSSTTTSSSSFSSSSSSSSSSLSYDSNEFESNKTSALSKKPTTPTPRKPKKRSITSSVSSIHSEEAITSKKKSEKTTTDNSMIKTTSELNDTKTMNAVDTVDEEDMEKSFKQVLPSKSHLKRNRKNTDHSSTNDISQTSLSESQSEFNQQSLSTATGSSIRISFEDDSFKKFTDELVKKYMMEEETRSKHQAHLLKLREKALIDKTNAELTWLEQMKKKAQDKGQDEKMPSLLKKQKGIMQKLKQEQENINQMKQVHKIATEKRLKILSKHSQVIKWCQNKLKQKQSNITDHNEKDEPDEQDIDESIHNISTNSTNNQSLLESKLMKQVKQHLNSEKFLTEREKKLRLRRKHAEEIIAWKKKLDDEERQVREIEKQAKLALNTKHQSASSTSSSSSSSAINIKIIQSSNETEINKQHNNEIRSESNIINRKQDGYGNASYSESFITTPIVTDRNKIQTETILSNESNHLTVNKTTDASIKTQMDENVETIANLDDEDDQDEDINTKTDIPEKDFNKITTITSTNTNETAEDLSHSSSSTNTAKELENNVKKLQHELHLKKQEAEKLKKSLKSKEKSKLKEKEENLRKKIHSYDSLIGTIKKALVEKEDIGLVVQEKEQENDDDDNDDNDEDDNDDQIKTVFDTAISASIVKTEPLILKEKKSSSSSSITLSSVSTSSYSNKQITSHRPSVVPSNEDKYDDDFDNDHESSSSAAKKPADIKQKNEDDTVSEISEDIMIESTTTDKSVNKSANNYNNNKNNDYNGKSSDSSDSESSSTDTQILTFGRSKSEINTEVSHQPSAQSPTKQEKKEEKSKKLVDSVEDMILNETINQMINIREKKNRKLAAEKQKDENREEQQNKIIIPTIDLSEPIKLDKSQELKEKIIKLRVPYHLEKINQLTDLAMQSYFWPRLEQNLELKSEYDENSVQLIDYFANSSSIDGQLTEELIEIEKNFKKMLFNLTGELMHDLYLERYENPKQITSYFPSVKKTIRKQYFKSIVKGPSNLSEAKRMVKQRIAIILKLSETNQLEQKNIAFKKSKWRSQKRLDLVDNLLDYEMREQEFEWSNYEAEEYEAKLLISNTIFDMLLKDTLDCFQANYIKQLNSSRISVF